MVVAMTTRSMEELVDLAERKHLSAVVEADFVNTTYTIAFDMVGKYPSAMSDGDAVALLRRACQGSIRVALLARVRARATADLNPNDEVAAAAVRLLTELAYSFIP